MPLIDYDFPSLSPIHSEYLVCAPVSFPVPLPRHRSRIQHKMQMTETLGGKLPIAPIDFNNWTYDRLVARSASLRARLTEVDKEITVRKKASRERVKIEAAVDSMVFLPPAERPAKKGDSRIEALYDAMLNKVSPSIVTKSAGSRRDREEDAAVTTSAPTTPPEPTSSPCVTQPYQ